MFEREGNRSYRLVPVRAYGELVEYLQRLSPPNAGRVRVFRGQVTDHGNLIPSRWRKGGAVAPADMAWVLGAYRILQKIFPQIGDVNSGGELSWHTRVLAEAIVQHYGLRSSYLDVALDLHTALWFALHDARHKAYRIQIILENRRRVPIMVGKAWYKPSQKEAAVLYVLDCDIWSGQGRPAHGQLIDLSAFAPFPVTSRVWRQKAGLLFSDQEAGPKGDLARFVKAAFRIENQAAWRDEVPGLAKSVLDLFPLPITDSVYSALLGSYFVYFQDQDAWYRTLAIPEYHSAEGTILSGPECDSYQQIWVLTSPAEYYPALVRHAQPTEVLVVGGSRFALKEAMWLKLQHPTWYVWFPDESGIDSSLTAADIAERLPQERLNVFFELSVFELVAPENPEAPVLRGIWVVKCGDEYVLQLWYRDKDGFSSPQPWRFQYIRKGRIFEEHPDNRHDDEWAFERLRRADLSRALRVLGRTFLTGKPIVFEIP